MQRHNERLWGTKMEIPDETGFEIKNELKWGISKALSADAGVFVCPTNRPTGSNGSESSSTNTGPDKGDIYKSILLQSREASVGHGILTGTSTKLPGLGTKPVRANSWILGAARDPMPQFSRLWDSR